jgi:hypothetical protein
MPRACHSPPASAQLQSPLFAALPPELRIAIFSYAVQLPHPVYLDCEAYLPDCLKVLSTPPSWRHRPCRPLSATDHDHDHDERPHPRPRPLDFHPIGILLACIRTHREARPLLYRLNLFSATPHGIRHLANPSLPRACNLVANLDFQWRTLEWSPLTLGLGPPPPPPTRWRLAARYARNAARGRPGLSTWDRGLRCGPCGFVEFHTRNHRAEHEVMRLREWPEAVGRLGRNGAGSASASALERLTVELGGANFGATTEGWSATEVEIVTGPLGEPFRRMMMIMTTGEDNRGDGSGGSKGKKKKKYAELKVNWPPPAEGRTMEDVLPGVVVKREYEYFSKPGVRMTRL